MKQSDLLPLAHMKSANSNFYDMAATRYVTAQKVVKNILWSTQNAEWLQHGELLSERDDD